MVGTNCFVRPCPHMLRIITTDKSQGKKVVLCPAHLTRYLLCRYDELERLIILYTCTGKVIEVKKANESGCRTAFWRNSRNIPHVKVQVAV